MKLITRDTDYALRALGFISGRRNSIVSVSELVRELRIPRPFLRKILQVLNKEGILESHKGKGGGFRLAVSPKKLYLMDLIQIFQGQFQLNECFFKKAICPDVRTCALKKKIDIIEEQVIRELSTITLASLLK